MSHELGDPTSRLDRGSLRVDQLFPRHIRESVVNYGIEYAPGDVVWFLAWTHWQGRVKVRVMRGG